MNELITGNLPLEIVKICDQANEKIKQIRLSTNRPLVPMELMEAAEYLLSFRAYLTGPLLESEARYRDIINVYRMEDMSVSAAETKAKTSPEYRAYKYLDRVDTLADEQVKLVKRFTNRLNDEFSR